MCVGRGVPGLTVTADLWCWSFILPPLRAGPGPASDTVADLVDSDVPQGACTVGGTCRPRSPACFPGLVPHKPTAPPHTEIPFTGDHECQRPSTPQENCCWGSDRGQTEYCDRKWFLTRALTGECCGHLGREEQCPSNGLSESPTATREPSTSEGRVVG